jgi:isocitrate dehydrogenase (NAD+)
MHRITLIPGEGIGPEVSSAMQQVINASGVKVEWDIQEVGAVPEKKEGTPLPSRVLESIHTNKVGFKGPITTPFGGSYRVAVNWERGRKPGAPAVREYPSISVGLRKELNLYANVRPTVSYPGIPSRYEGVDLISFRENTEDLYAGIEHWVTEDVAESIKVITRKGSERFARFCFQYARDRGRKKMTVVHKSNIMKLTDGLFLHVAEEVGKAFPEIVLENRVVDNMCMQLVVKPEDYDCLLMPNLYGDILSDLCAGLVGGLGVAPGGNMGDQVAVFEPVHGSAPKYAGQDRVNPMASVLCGVMMMQYLGEMGTARRIEEALRRVLAEGRYLTRDLGGSSGTREMTQAIIGQLKKS